MRWLIMECRRQSLFHFTRTSGSRAAHFGSSAYRTYRTPTTNLVNRQKYQGYILLCKVRTKGRSANRRHHHFVGFNSTKCQGSTRILNGNEKHPSSFLLTKKETAPSLTPLLRTYRLQKSFWSIKSHETFSFIKSPALISQVICTRSP